MIRILLVADTHLGFDLPFHPRIERRRRGKDFFDNLERALQPGFRGEVDLVVHGGDLLYRSRVPPALVEMALEPLIRLAETGLPVFLVPGNHERSQVPLHLWARHPNLHIFDRPRTFLCAVRGCRVALVGLPFVREVRDRFVPLLAQTGYGAIEADVRLLCIHQAVEGAQVGPADYTFRSGSDVVRGRDIPTGFDAVLAGHIHRAQVLKRDLQGRRLPAPVIYPGSVERTAFAERFEPKGYALVQVESAGRGEGSRVRAEFIPLPARPMVVLELEVACAEPEELQRQARTAFARLDPDAVVRVHLTGQAAAEARTLISAGWLRALAPVTMNVELAPERGQSDS